MGSDFNWDKEVQEALDRTEFMAISTISEEGSWTNPMPGARDIYSYWQKYFTKWNVQMNEGEFVDFWFNAEKENAEMVGLARELKAKGMRLFILSNNLRERSAYYDKHFPFLKELFEKEYYSWQTGFVKPDPRCFETILTENNLKAEDCIYFDDSEKNVVAAQSFGIESYMYTGPGMVREKIT